MGYNEVLGYQNVDVNDVKISLAEINTTISAAMDARKTILKKFIMQNCPYKKGQKFLVKTTKGKKKIVTLSKICWDSLRSVFFYEFKCGKKKLGSHHVISMISI